MTAEDSHIGAMAVELAAAFAKLSSHTLAMATAIHDVTGLHADVGGLCNGCDRFWPCATYLAAISWTRP